MNPIRDPYSWRIRIDVLNDYRANGRRSLDEAERRIDKHLSPYFGGRRMAAITTADVRAYVAQRLAERTIHRKAYVITRKDGSQHHIPACERSTGGTSHGQINRELTILKRAFTLACQAGKLLVRPYIPMLKESNTRTGFFEAQQLEGVIRHLPTALQPVIRFAYITGWRIDSEVLPIEWRNVDFAAGEVRLDPHVAKNDEGRVFPLTVELRRLLEARHV